MDFKEMPVLLCYSEQDAAAAEKLRDFLEKNQISCAHENGFYSWDVLEIASEILDCGCALILISEAAEGDSRIDYAVKTAISHDIPMVFVYLEECVFTAMPVDNAEQIHIFHADAGQFCGLLQILGEVCDVQYGEESFGSEAVKRRLTELEREYSPAGFFGTVPIFQYALILIIAVAAALLIRYLLKQNIQELLQAIGFGIPSP